MSYNPECSVIVGKTKPTQISELHKQILPKQKWTQYNQHEQKHLKQWLGTKYVTCSTVIILLDYLLVVNI